MSVSFALTRGMHVAATMLLASIAGAMLVCLAPGSGIDENALNPNLSEESRAALDAARAADREPLRFIPRYLAGLARGDMGRSDAFNRPVSTLIGERWRVTAGSIAQGLAAAWLLGLALAAIAASSGGSAPPVSGGWQSLGGGWQGMAAVGIRMAASGIGIAAHGAAGLMLSTPAALVALLLAASRLPAGIGIAFVVFPKIYTVSETLLRDAFGRPWVTAARARGAGNWRVFTSHVMLPAARPLAALAAVTLPVALGSSIPLEALGGQPGLGQLAWRATLARDVNLLVGMTLIITAVTLAANFAAELASAERGSEAR